MKRTRISRSAFLDILKNRLENPNLEPNEFTSLARLYAEVMGWKERIRARKPEKKPNEKRTMDDFILHMEKQQKEKKLG